METQNTIEDWRDDITTAGTTFKVKDGETKNFTFLDEGNKKESKDYGNSIAFKVMPDQEKEAQTFYVKSNNFALLGQIKELGKLAGLRVSISRIGAKKSDTRYTLKKL